MNTVEERIKELLECAKEEDITVNEESLSDLRKLLSGGRPLIFLLDNGNFRLMWNFKNSTIGVEIKGGNEVSTIVLPFGKPLDK